MAEKKGVVFEMSNMLHLRRGQKMFISAEDGTKGKRDYLGYLDIETDDFIKLRICDKKHDDDYFYIIPKRLILGWKLYFEIRDFD